MPEVLIEEGDGMTEVYLMVYRSPITREIKGELFEDERTANMMAVATATTYHTEVTVRKQEVDLP